MNGKTRRKEIARQEATRDPIFLLQRGDVVITDTSNLSYSSDTEEYYDTLTGETLSEEQLLEWGVADITWRTESVWATREEPEAFAEKRSYNYGKKGKDWMVYCVCAEGELKTILEGVE